MIQSQAGTKPFGSGTLKQYVIAVLVGVLLGGAYASTEQPPKSQVQLSLPKQPATPQSHMAKSLRAGDDCGARVDIQPADVVVARPMLISGGAADRYADVGPAHVIATVCTWAI